MDGKLYAKRDIIGQGEFYTRHVMAMTAEGLHDKSSIAAELAHRDQRIKYLEANVEACSARNSSDVDRIAELEAGIKGAIGLIEGNLEVTARDLLHGIAGSYDVGDDAERLKKHLAALLTQEEGG